MRRRRFWIKVSGSSQPTQALPIIEPLSPLGAGRALDHLRAALDSGHDGIRRLLQADRFFDALRERPELAELQGSPPQESNLRRFVPRNDRKGPIS